MSFEIVEGDLEPDMSMTAVVNGVAKDLSSASSVEMYWVKPDGTADTVTLTAVALASGQVKRVWEAGDTDVVGTHRGRIVVTWPTAEVQTFPSDGTWHYWWVNPATL